MSNLGCARNLVDSEIMHGQLAAAGFMFTPDPAMADTIIVNTCSFIESAVDESVDEILELAEFKKSGQCKQFIVAGCLPERFKKELAESLPEVDAFLGTGAYHEIVKVLSIQQAKGICLLPSPDTLPLQTHGMPRIPSTTAMAYLKVTEGCNRHCTYCMIPKLRGALRSRSIDDIEAEARHLIATGFRELVIIGQDTGCYGRDLGADINLPRLLDNMADISADTWIRFLYGSPDTTDERLIRTVAAHENICSYFDIPIQHADSRILKRMGRQYDGDALIRLFADIRKIIPDAALRTTVMVGFPGETDSDFERMLNFIKTVKFDHLGAFIYSDSEELSSHRLPGHVPADIAEERHHVLMSAQVEISAEKNQNHIGQIYPVLVEEQLEPGLFSGRTAFQAPEVDGIVYIDSKDAVVGEFADVRIDDALEYDLRGETI
jgi:ribosomal protein S12 methylthiotransferase